MKRQFHYIFFACTIALTVICGILMTRVNVNADMTKYLPDDSQMKYGLDIVTNEFGASAQMVGADVHIMFDSISPAEIEGMCALLAAYPDVDKVAYRYSADSAHTVFDLTVAKQVNQKALGKQISNRFGGNCVVETSQDGATPPMSVMVIAAVLIMLVLFLMAQSWFEPVVILISTGVAIVLNMGTNALLPSVSITTNFIGSMLQAVLSLDYCIILLNRYRQEQNEHTDRVTAGIAVNKAVKASSSSILSSALTTVVGLLMLCFMRLKIGADMGIVLAKGVVCSLVCTFTVMPSLMLLFRRVINKTQKRVFVPNTAGLARFVTSHKVSMALGALLLFFGSWYFSRQTTIFFSAEAESQIERIFPAPNPIVLVYDTQDERALVPLVDSLVQDSNVQMVLSYPTLLSHPRTPEQTIKHIQSLIPLMASQMPASATAQVAPFLQPSAMSEMGSMVNMLYFMRANHGLETTMTFPDLARFLHTHCVNNPLMASFIDDDMRQQVELLQSMLLTEETPDTPLDSQEEASLNPNSLNPNSLNANSLNANSLNANSLNANSLNPNSLNTNSLNPNSLNDTSNIVHSTSNIVHRTSADLQAELFTELAFGGKHYTPAQMASKLSRLMKLSGVKSAPITAEQMSLLYMYYESVQHPCDSIRVGLDQLIAYACDTLIADPRIAPMVPDSIRTQVKDVQQQLASGMGQLRKENHSLCVILTSLPPESKQTTAFVNSLSAQADAALAHDYYMLGESVMYVEMQAGFNHEMNVVTLFTILVIFLIVAITFRSVIVPTILVATVMTAVYVNVVVSGLVSGQMLYLAYLIVQAILMGATIDYGILFANYYRENRRTMTRRDAAAAAYKGSIRTILTSGLIMVIAPGVMAALIEDVMISNIVSCLAVGAFMAIVLILTVVPAVLVALDRLVVYGKKNRFSAPAQSAEKESVSLPTETTTPTAEE